MKNRSNYIQTIITTENTMKKLLFITLAAASFSGLANADNGVYASLKAGASDTKIKNMSMQDWDGYSFTHDSQSKTLTPNLSLAVGYDFSTISDIDARAELAYTYVGSKTYHFNQITDQSYVEETNATNKIKSQSIMLNGYYDFKNSSKFTPYVSAGLGMTRVKGTYYNDYNFEDGEVSDSSTKFTWALGLGVAYNVWENVDLDLSYRYNNAGKFKFKGAPLGESDISNINYKLQSNEYLLGLRYNF